MLDNVTATLVPDEQRQNFLPGLFGLNRLIISENMVYAFMEQLSPLDYGGGYWTFHELDGKPLFLAPTSKPRFRISWEGNGYEGEVSAEAAGIIATMFALSHLSFRFDDDRFGEAYLRLYEYAADHPEAPEIFQAID